MASQETDRVIRTRENDLTNEALTLNTPFRLDSMLEITGNRNKFLDVEFDMMRFDLELDGTEYYGYLRVLGDRSIFNEPSILDNSIMPAGEIPICINPQPDQELKLPVRFDLGILQIPNIVQQGDLECVMRYKDTTYVAKPRGIGGAQVGYHNLSFAHWVPEGVATDEFPSDARILFPQDKDVVDSIQFMFRKSHGNPEK